MMENKRAIVKERMMLKECGVKRKSRLLWCSEEDTQQLAFFGFNSFPKKEKRFCVCHWVGDLLPTSCFVTVIFCFDNKS